MKKKLRNTFAAGSRENHGFILIYVLLIMVAMISLLSLIPKTDRGGVDGSKINAAMERRKIVNVFDYVLRHSIEKKGEIDPRLLKYNKLRLDVVQQKAESDERLAMLKAILDSMNFKVDIKDPKKNKSATSPGDSTGNQGKDPKQDELVQTVRFVPSKTPYTITLGDDNYLVYVRPINTKPNINYMDPKTMLRYLKFIGLTDAEAGKLTGVIQDWIDPDEETTLLGAETSYYKMQTPPYTARNGPIGSWSEANYIKGLTQSTIRLLRSNFRLQGESLYIDDPQSADLIAVLADIPADTVKKIIKNHAASSDGSGFKELVSLDDERKFNRVASWERDEEFESIRIESKQINLEAIYNIKGHYISEWWYI